MQKGYTPQYVTAGLQATPGMRIHVRSCVNLPDSEAGRAQETDRQPFRAGYVPPAPRESVVVPLRGALIFLCVLFCVFGGMIISKAAQRSELSKKITSIEQEISETRQTNQELATQVEEARDASRICDIACQKLQMIAPSRATTEYVTAPDTRPLEVKTTAQAETSPYAALDGMITGSR
ncbi:MAG: septum formation initiator family protein [Clostridia bacterium]|nr:septum formation initiator family protein [Clostridia bacterium]